METTQKVKKNDFIEIEFTGTSNNQIFDTTNPKEAEQMGVDPKNTKPLIISVGNEMMLKGFDDSLEGKELNKEYSINLTPEKAFGKRDPQLIKTIPIKVFHEKNINPMPGMPLQLDNAIVKVISVSGGRVMVDFNNPLAGKDVEYTFKINKKISDDKEKINALQDYFFKQKFEFEIKDKKVIFKDDKIKPLIEMMNERFKQMTGFDFEVEDKKEKSVKETTSNATQGKGEEAQVSEAKGEEEKKDNK